MMLKLTESEQFQLLCKENILILVNTLNKKLPNSCHALCFVKQVTEWKKNNTSLNVCIYSPNGNYSDCTFLLHLKFNGESMCTYYSESESGCQRLKEALSNTKIFDGEESLLITAVADRIHTIVGTSWCKMKFQHSSPCYLFSVTLDKAKSLHAKCPEDVYVNELREEDAELINSVWPHRNSKSVHLIREIIRTSTCLGIYTKDSNQLLSWALRWFYGGIGVLQTLDHAKRRGYAQVIISSLCAKLIEESWPIHATVVVENHESIPLFSKMGFTKQFICHYLEFENSTGSTLDAPLL